MKFWTASGHRRDIGKLAVTCSMLLLWLASFALAVSPQLHKLLHQDAHNLNHHCLITQIKQQNLVTGAPVALLTAPPTCEFHRVARLDSQFVASFDFRLFPVRGPPAICPSTTVVG